MSLLGEICDACDDTGDCPECGGEGTYEEYDPGMGGYEIYACAICDGTGCCPHCEEAA